MSNLIRMFPKIGKNFHHFTQEIFFIKLKFQKNNKLSFINTFIFFTLLQLAITTIAYRPTPLEYREYRIIYRDGINFSKPEIYPVGNTYMCLTHISFLPRYYSCTAAGCNRLLWLAARIINCFIRNKKIQSWFKYTRKCNCVGGEVMCYIASCILLILKRL